MSPVGAAAVFALVVFVSAALAEIADCFSFWAVLRLHRPAWWLGPGLVTLVLFAVLLTRIDAAAAGRAYATYGGVYVCASLAWLGAVENTRPDRWDALGAAICLLGAGIILFGPRTS